MKKHLFLTLFLAQWFAVSAWCQGFGNRELIDDGWSFHLGDVTYGGAEYFDASGWRTLNLPHDWSVESTASPALASCTGYLPGGIGWYRKDLNIPAEAKGRRVFIYFEGVYNNRPRRVRPRSIPRSCNQLRQNKRSRPSAASSSSPRPFIHLLVPQWHSVTG